MPSMGKLCVADSRPFTVVLRDDVVEIAFAESDMTRSQTRWRRAQRLSGLLRGALGTGARTVIVDLQRPGDADTFLLAVLIDAKKRARHSGAELVIRGSPALHQLAEICCLKRALCFA